MGTIVDFSPSEIRYQLILDAAIDAVVSVDVGGRIVDWNSRAVELFGWTKDEVVGHELASLVFAERWQARFGFELRRYADTTQSDVVNRRLRVTAWRREKRAIHVELVICPVRVGELLLFTTFFRDVSSGSPAKAMKRSSADVQLVEQALMLSAQATFEEALRTALRFFCDSIGAPLGHVWWPDQTDSLLVTSGIWHQREPQRVRVQADLVSGLKLRQGEGLAGRVWSRQEAAFTPILKNEPDLPREVLRDARVLRSALAIPVFANRRVAAVLEFFLAETISPDPRVMSLGASVAVQIGRVLERQQWEEDRLRLAAIVDSSADAIIGRTLEGIITSWNSGAETVYGYTAAEAIRQPIGLIIPGGLSREEEALVANLEREQVCPPFETMRRHKSGARIPVAVTVSPICNRDGHMIGIATIERDITLRRQRELELQQAKDAAEAANIAKNAFLANVSHELRTPMNAIIGMLELGLMGGDLSTVLRDHLETARDSAQVLLSLVTDLLDLSRLEGGHFDLDPHPFDLRTTLDNAIRALALRAHEKGLELACHIHHDVPDHLEGDALRLRQIVMNLAYNAIKFTEQGEVVVTVSVESRTTDQVQLLISISDTGIGIAGEDQKRIFKPFTQVDSSMTRRYSGAGLGLTIAQELVTRMGGRIWLTSNPGAGSHFYCTPRFKVLPAIAKPLFPPIDDLRNVRVLIVDDNATNRRILEEALLSWDMQPQSVENAHEAITCVEQAIAESNPFALLIVDALMPQVDGFELISTLVDRGFTAADNILMVSSVDRRTFEDRCGRIPVTAFLEKPLSQTALLDAVLTAVRGTPTERPSIDSVAGTGESLSVLVVEDTPANQKVLRAFLERAGHRVTIANNGRDAVDRFRREMFHVILMDIQMPTMDGIQATAAIRGSGDARSQVPIVAMTAHAMRGDRERCLAAGMDAYLAKPIDLQELLRVITQLTEQGSEPALSAPRESAPAAPTARTDSRRHPVFDRRATLQRLGGDESLLRDMARFFVEDSAVLLNRLQRALETGDAAEATLAAHSLKGLAGNLGARDCEHAASVLEATARAGKLRRSVDMLSSLRHEIERLINSLRADSILDPIPNSPRSTDSN